MLLYCKQENIYRNFGMPQPNGYRKALRFMRHADKFGFPIVTFVDTPGAFAGKNAEELGQGEVSADSCVTYMCEKVLAIHHGLDGRGSEGSAGLSPL